MGRDIGVKLSCVWHVTACGVLVALSGCAFDAASMPDGVDAEPAADAQQALIPFDPDKGCDPAKYTACYLQSSGPTADFKVKMYECPATASGSKLEANCQVEAGWTLIGGGGQILDAAVGDVLLTSSRPRDTTSADSLYNDRTWHISTESTGAAHNHRVVVHAIAMRMKGYDNVNKIAPITLRGGTWSPFDIHPHAAVKVPSTDILLGGGWLSTGDVEGPQDSRYMAIVDAYATAGLDGTLRNGTWTINGSSTIAILKESIVPYAISVRACPLEWSSCFSASQIIATKSTTGSGTRAASALNTNSGYYTTGVGAISSSYLRPIFRFRPLRPQADDFGGGHAATFDDGEAGYVKVQALTLAR